MRLDLGGLGALRVVVLLAIEAQGSNARPLLGAVFEFDQDLVAAGIAISALMLFWRFGCRG